MSEMDASKINRISGISAWIREDRCYLSLLLILLNSALLIPLIRYGSMDVMHDFGSEYYFFLDDLFRFYLSPVRYGFFLMALLFAGCLYGRWADARRVLLLQDAFGLLFFLLIYLERRVVSGESAGLSVPNVLFVLLPLLVLLLFSLPAYASEKGVRKTWKEETVLLLSILACSFAYAFLLPLLVDYAVLREGSDFLSFVWSGSSLLYSGGYLLEILAIAALGVLLTLLLRSLFAGTTILSVLLLALTFFSRVKYANRHEILSVRDLRLTEAGGMALRYLRPDLSHYLLLLTVALLLFGMAFFRMGKQFKVHSFRLVPVFLCLCALGFSVFWMPRLDSAALISEEYSYNYGNHLVLAHFFSSGLSVSSIPEPEESLAWFEEVTAEMPEPALGYGVAAASSDYPDIIVIMNESWWDTDGIDVSRSKVSYAPDPMEPVKRLQDAGAFLGHTSVNIFGGGTVNSEIEFLSGINTKYFSGSDSIYSVIAESKEITTLSDHFKELGYGTCAIHPYYGSFYNREKVYANMSFDRVLFYEDLTHRDPFVRYVSDESLVSEILQQYREMKEEDPDRPLFLWNVSVANHVTTLDFEEEERMDYDYPVRVDFADGTKNNEPRAIINYLNGIYLAGEAFAELVSSFQDTDRPVLLLMYGDHCPNFTFETIDDLGFSDYDLSLEKKKALYSTPVVEWDNFSDEPFSFNGGNIGYLTDAVLVRCGLPEPPMARYLRYMESLFAADTVYYTLDGKGEELSSLSSRQQEAILHFHSLQSGLLSGDPALSELWINGN